MKTTMQAIFTPAGRIAGFSLLPVPVSPPSSLPFPLRRCHLSKVHAAVPLFNLHTGSTGPATTLNSSMALSATPNTNLLLLYILLNYLSSLEFPF